MLRVKILYCCLNCILLYILFLRSFNIWFPPEDKKISKLSIRLHHCFIIENVINFFSSQLSCHCWIQVSKSHVTTLCLWLTPIIFCHGNNDIINAEGSIDWKLYITAKYWDIKREKREKKKKAKMKIKQNKTKKIRHCWPGLSCH